MTANEYKITRKNAINIINNIYKEFKRGLDVWYDREYGNNKEYQLTDETKTLVDSYASSILPRYDDITNLLSFDDDLLSDMLCKCVILANLYNFKISGLPDITGMSGTKSPFKIINDDAMFVNMRFIKSQRKLYVSTINGFRFSTIYNASNEPSQKDAPEKKLTTPKDGSTPKNYYPQKFPNGRWKIIGEKPADGTDAEGTKVLKTNAEQIIKTYSFIYNKEKKEYEWLATGTQIDAGYNIHDGKGVFADWTKTTVGCIRVETSTINELSKLYNITVKTSGGMVLHVSN